MDYRLFEQRLLDVLFTTQVPITAGHMAYYARIPVREAEKHLEKMVEEGILRKECDLETGALTYLYPERTALPLPARTQLPPAEPELWVRPHSTLLAVLLSVLLPGSGHMYAGRVRSGVRWMVFTFLAYMAVVPGIILHTLCVLSVTRLPYRLLPEPQGPYPQTW